MYHIKEAAQLSGVSVKDPTPLRQDRTLGSFKVGKWLSNLQSGGFGTPSGHSLL